MKIRTKHETCYYDSNSKQQFLENKIEISLNTVKL
jgi:hypothetical protein